MTKQVVKRNHAKEYRCDALLGPKMEEDKVGELVIDRAAFLKALLPTLSRRFDWTDAEWKEHEPLLSDLADFLLTGLEGALAGWLRDFAAWELPATGMPSDQFYALLLQLDPAHSGIFAVPEVQAHLATMRADLKGTDRSNLARWFVGTGRSGRPKHSKPDVVKASYGLRKRQLDRVIKSLVGARNKGAALRRIVVDYERKQPTDRAKSPHYGLLSALAQHGLLDDLCQQYGSPRFRESITAQLTAKETVGTSASTVRRIARSK